MPDRDPRWMGKAGVQVGPAQQAKPKAPGEARHDEPTGRADGLVQDSGFPLPVDVRARLEPIIGDDMSAVRLHTGANAAAHPGLQGALAVAHGQHIWFATGMYRPGTVVGDVVLAHELAHTRQQDGEQGGSQAGATVLEREADQAGYLAALALLQPSSRARVPPARISKRQGLQLQRCTPTIDPLPTREEYERQGKLDPLTEEWPGGIPWPAMGGPVAGRPILTPLGGPAQQPEVTPQSADLASAGLFSAGELGVRLTILRALQTQIDTLVADLGGGSGSRVAVPMLPPWSAGDQNIVEAQGRLGLIPTPLALPPTTGTTPVTEGLPEDRIELARAVLTAEPQLRRTITALQELSGVRADEELTSQRLEGYDTISALTAVDEVRRAYRDAADRALTAAAVPALATADRQKTGLQGRLMSLKLAYYRGRTSTYSGVQPSIRMIHEWAAMLQQKVAGLSESATKVDAARTSRLPELPLLESEFTARAQLIEVSIEALGEWDRALQAYELLAGNSALWGYSGVEAIVSRLAEMRLAAYMEDLPYLQLLVRDHRADPNVNAFYAKIPSIIEWSHVVIGLAITLVAAVATAGVGLVVGVVAESVAGAAGLAAASAGASATVTGYVVVTTEFLVNLGGEAFVFTFISRQLSSLVPGMAPKNSFWSEFIWNVGLLGVMKGATAAAKGIIGAMAVTSAAGKLGITAVTQFAALEAFGVARFAFENHRMMNLTEFAKMSAQNAIVMGVMAVTMMPLRKPMERWQKAMPASSLAKLARAYRAEAATIAARRAALEAEVTQRIQDKPDATADQAQDVTDQAQQINSDLQDLVSRIETDQQIDPAALSTEVDSLLGEVQVTPVPDLMVGLEQSAELRPTGQETVWTYAHGKGQVVADYLAAGDYQVTTASGPLVGGLDMIEAAVPGKGQVTFVERPPELAAKTAEPAGPEVLTNVGRGTRNANEALEWISGQTVRPTLLGRLAEVARTNPKLVRDLLELTGRVNRARGGPDPAALAAGDEIAAEALSRQRAADEAVAEALEAALKDPDGAGKGLQRLARQFPPRYPKALGSILATAPADNVPNFLRAMADPDLGGQSYPFYQGLARSRAACDLVTRYGGKMLLKIVNLQPGRLPSERMFVAGPDITRVLAGLDAATAAGPEALAAKQLELKRLPRSAKPGDLDLLVGPRARPVVEFEAKTDDPSWGPSVKKAEVYERDHPPDSPLSPETRKLRATLYQMVGRARNGEFGHLSAAEAQAMLETFNDLADAAGMDRGWKDAMRGRMNEGLARKTAPESERTVWFNGKVIRQGRAPKDSTIPDDAWPPVTRDQLDSGAVERVARRWYEDKAYGLRGAPGADGVRAGARSVATKHLGEARGDLTNLPKGSTIALRYSIDPGPATQRAMADILYAEPGIEQVIFQGVVVPRR